MGNYVRAVSFKTPWPLWFRRPPAGIVTCLTSIPRRKRIRAQMPAVFWMKGLLFLSCQVIWCSSWVGYVFWSQRSEHFLPCSDSIDTEVFVDAICMLQFLYEFLRCSEHVSVAGCWYSCSGFATGSNALMSFQNERVSDIIAIIKELQCKVFEVSFVNCRICPVFCACTQPDCVGMSFECWPAGCRTVRFPKKKTFWCTY